MKIIQLTNNDGDPIGLYQTERTDEQVEKDIEGAFDLARGEADGSDDLSPHEIADEYLEKLGITRIFADEVFVNI